VFKLHPFNASDQEESNEHVCGVLAAGRRHGREHIMESETTLLTTLRALRDVDVGLALSNISAYHIAFDRWHDARVHAREALEVAREARQYVEVAWMLQHLAAIAALAPAPVPEHSDARLVLAALLLGYVDEYSARVGGSRKYIEHQEYERALAALRTRVDGDHLAGLMASGRAMTLNEAIAYALSV
jgi:hypothetical protein